MRNLLPGFTYAGTSSRVVFGAGSLEHLEREVERSGARRPVVLSTPGQRAYALRLAQRLARWDAAAFTEAAMHVPAALVDEGLAFIRHRQADALVAFGGGSTIGLAKAIALETGLPILAIPTTYAGSEMTPVYGITRDGVKHTGRSPRVQPATVIYDPQLSTSLPVDASVTSALNAMAHAVEGLYAQDANPVTDLMACEGIRALAAAIPGIRRDPAGLEARAQALYGAWMCGTVLGSVGMSLHHKLCHTLGGSFDLPHAEVHAVVLPYALDFNAQAAPAAVQRIEAALGAAPGAGAATLQQLARAHGAPTSLRELGMREDDLDAAAALAVSSPYANPRPVGPGELADVRELLQRAYEGAAL